MNSLDEALTDLGTAILTFTNQVRPAVEQLGRALEVAEELRALIEAENTNEPAPVVPIRPEPEPKPKIGDTRPAPSTPDPKTITRRLQGDGRANWDEQLKDLVDGKVDRIVRQVGNEKAATQQKYFIQNKDRRVRVDVLTTDGETVIEVRRREEDE